MLWDQIIMPNWNCVHVVIIYVMYINNCIFFRAELNIMLNGKDGDLSMFYICFYKYTII